MIAKIKISFQGSCYQLLLKGQCDSRKAEMVNADLCLTNLGNAFFSRPKICMAKIT